ncbi:MAG: hypothetical protein ACFFC1_17050, partial [Promethearchaeota archaeon]
SKKKQPLSWSLKDIGLESINGQDNRCLTRVVRLFQPVRENECEIVSGESSEETGMALAARLREAKLLGKLM